MKVWFDNWLWGNNWILCDQLAMAAALDKTCILRYISPCKLLHIFKTFSMVFYLY
jgi:hypothetical protein